MVGDLGGVVARFDPAARLAALANATGLDPMAIDAAVWGSGLDAAAERGELSHAEVWSQTLAALGYCIGADTLRRCWALAFVDLGVPIERPAALFTDNGPILAAALRHELRSIASRFDHVLLSCDVGATKQHPIAFERAAARLGLPPDELTLRDDRAENVEAARHAGWRAELVSGRRVGGAATPPSTPR
jgi:putative hydrolase of the HAD superfamily